MIMKDETRNTGFLQLLQLKYKNRIGCLWLSLKSRYSYADSIFSVSPVSITCLRSVLAIGVGPLLTTHSSIRINRWFMTCQYELHQTFLAPAPGPAGLSAGLDIRRGAAEDCRRVKQPKRPKFQPCKWSEGKKGRNNSTCGATVQLHMFVVW